MRVGNIAGRAKLIVGDLAIDIGQGSGGRFPSSIHTLFGVWSDFSAWAREGNFDVSPAPFAPQSLEVPSPTPSQVFAIGMNYIDHAMDEAKLKELPKEPAVFTKFPTCLSGPSDDLVLPSASVDWEVELVVVIGHRTERVAAKDGLDHVAGFCIGQDYSDRVVQLKGGMPQFSLGKSFPGFGRFGPCLVTIDEFENPNDLAIDCTINGTHVQGSRTSKLIFPVGDIISYLSHICPLLPGDVIFTGTPAGVGGARNPQVFLKPGDIVVSTLEGVGSIRQECRAAL